MSDLKINNITDRTGSSGPVIAGVCTATGTGAFIVPVGPTEYRGGRGRGVTGGGYSPYRNYLNKIEIATTGNAEDFGDLNQALRGPSDGVSSSTRGLFGGGLGPSSNASRTVITYVTISSDGGANDFGDLTVARFMVKGHSNNTRGIFTGGYATSPGRHTNTIDYVTIASTGDATDFGTITPTPSRSTFGSGSSPTRGVFGGGYYAPGVDVTDIDYITLATRGNSETFGNLNDARRDVGGLSSSTRAIFAGGTDGGDPNSNDTIDYVTIATLGDATDFGDMTEGGRNRPAGMSNSTRGCFAAGRISGGGVNSISHITIATTGNTADFGDLTFAGYEVGGVSDSHGGIG